MIMATFHFKATNATGELYEGNREAPDQFALYQDLKKEGDTVLYATVETKSPTQVFNRLFIGLQRVSMLDKVTFARNLGAMIEAGLSLPRALAVLERQTKNPKFLKVLQAIETGIKKGQSLAETLKNYPDIFPSLFVSMVKAGEEGGTLAASLKAVSGQMNQIYLLEKRVRGAMIYPAILVCLMATIGVLMLMFVVPTLTATFKDLNVQLPWSTRLIIFLSDTLKSHAILLIIAVIAAVAGIVSMVRMKIGKKYFDTFILWIPVVSRIIKETNTARTARTLSSLLSSGVSAVTALDITGEVVQHERYRAIIKKAAAAIQKGNPLYDVFASDEKIYPPFFTEMVGIGEETGKLSSMLLDVAGYYEEEVERQTKDFSTVIEPVLMILVGVMVGFFAVSMIIPIYSLSNAF